MENRDLQLQQMMNKISMLERQNGHVFKELDVSI